jgi:putative ABC transport system ATP-binding protein
MLIETQLLSKIYRTEEIETYSLDSINFSINTGEFVAIMGPSGCGKSTLLNILGLLDKPSSGKYLFDGNEVSHLNEKQGAGIRKANIGFVFQSFNLIDELSVFENIELPLLYLNINKTERNIFLNNYQADSSSVLQFAEQLFQNLN